MHKSGVNPDAEFSLLKFCSKVLLGFSAFDVVWFEAWDSLSVFSFTDEDEPSIYDARLGSGATVDNATVEDGWSMVGVTASDEDFCRECEHDLSVDPVKSILGSEVNL